MSIVLNASELTLNDLHKQFAITRITESAFFPEWCTALPALTEVEQIMLDRVQRNFLDQLAARSIIEETVKMVVISPLLDLAGFYRSPYGIESEVPIQVVIPSEDGILQGRIDTLIVQHKLWILAVESKRTQLSLHVALPQAIAYLLATPIEQTTAFGLVTNGSEFMFIKFDRTTGLHYDLSNIFSLLNRGNDLYIVAQILKQLG
jgi:hypothetical protein